MKKKIITLILSLIMLFSVAQVTSMALIPGDVDGNGKTEATDARLALRAAVGLENKKELLSKAK